MITANSSDAARSGLFFSSGQKSPQKMRLSVNPAAGKSVNSSSEALALMAIVEDR